MWRWLPGASEPAQQQQRGEVSSSSSGGAGGGSSSHYYRLLPDERDPESLSLHQGLQFTDAPSGESISPLEKADVVFLLAYLALVLAYAAVVLVSVWLAAAREHALGVVAGGNAVLLAASGAVEARLRRQIRGVVQRQGFLRLSAQLLAPAGVPFAVVAYGAAGALLLVQWQGEVEALVRVPAAAVLRGWALAEAAAAGACAAWYVRKLWRFNSLQAGQEGQADAVQMLASVLRAQELEDVKYTAAAEGGDRLAEAQATVVQYQQQNLVFLGREVVRLRERLAEYERAEDAAGDGALRGADAAAVLAAREQELRAVTAERDQLQGEVRLARREICERNAEIAKASGRVESLLEESARLRAMLDEWSSHAAKVELALETERQANVELRSSNKAAHGSSCPPPQTTDG